MRRDGALCREVTTMVPVLYEDNHLLIVQKPQNMPAQADSSGDPDLLTVLKAYVKEKYNKPGDVYLGLVHRLDRPAGGVMAFARTSKAAARLSAQLKTRQMSRTYLAVVAGAIKEDGAFCDWLLKDERSNMSRVVPEGTPGAKFARLSYRVLGVCGGNTLVEVHLETGRSHQIRVQFANAGHPLSCDQKYNRGAERGDLALWAWKLSLEHPTKKEPMTFVCLPPDHAPWNAFEKAWKK